MYQKIRDPITGAYFYFNVRTGESSWKKPKLLGNRDLHETFYREPVEAPTEENTEAVDADVIAAAGEGQGDGDADGSVEGEGTLFAGDSLSDDSLRSDVDGEVSDA